MSSYMKEYLIKEVANCIEFKGHILHLNNYLNIDRYKLSAQLNKAYIARIMIIYGSPPNKITTQYQRSMAIDSYLEPLERIKCYM